MNSNMKKEGRKLHSLYFYIKKFAEAIETPDEKPDTSKGKWVVHDVRISFVAPPTTVTETLNIKKDKKNEANFQWKRFSLVLSDSKKENWAVYLVDLEPWGVKINGTQNVDASDYKGKVLDNELAKISVKEVEGMFPNLLKKPNLEPDYPESMVTYINAHEMDKGKEYSPTAFKNKFLNVKNPDGSPFYILYSKTNEILTPFGDTVGQKPI